MYVLVLYTISPQLLPIKNVDNTAPIIVKKLPSFSLLFRLFVLILLSVIIAQPINVLILKSSSTSLLNDIRFLLSNNFYASVITLIVVAIFLAPIYLKYIIRNFEEYFEKIKEVNMKIISRDYAEFKIVYSQILEERLRMRNVEISKNLVKSLARLKIASSDEYVRMKLEFEGELKHEKLSKYEYWQDPPFRTVKSASVQSGMTEEDLLKYIYTERT